LISSSNSMCRRFMSSLRLSAAHDQATHPPTAPGPDSRHGDSPASERRKEGRKDRRGAHREKSPRAPTTPRLSLPPHHNTHQAPTTQFSHPFMRVRAQQPQRTRGGASPNPYQPGRLLAAQRITQTLDSQH
jgi:hypothetical protein